MWIHSKTDTRKENDLTEFRIIDSEESLHQGVDLINGQADRLISLHTTINQIKLYIDEKNQWNK